MTRQELRDWVPIIMDVYLTTSTLSPIPELQKQKIKNSADFNLPISVLEIRFGFDQYLPK
jgi:hypothetical protein